MLAYLDAGSGAAIATLIASGTVGVSAVWGSARRRVRQKLGRDGIGGEAGAAAAAAPEHATEPTA